MFGFCQHGGSLGGGLWIAISVYSTTAGSAQEARIPPLIYEGLAAEKFADRESAQRQLLEWSRKLPEKSLPLLYRQSQEAPDPEIRSRCLGVLKDLVIEREYKADGFLGIGMSEVGVELPNKGGATQAIRVTMVVVGSGAEQAGITAGALIVGLDDQTWKKEGMMGEFSGKIRNLKPGNEVTLQLLENGGIVRKKVKLGERPIASLDPENEEPAMANQRAKDLFFRQWLDKRGKQPR